jgi:hypothetical protein
MKSAISSANLQSKVIVIIIIVSSSSSSSKVRFVLRRTARTGAVTSSTHEQPNLHWHGQISRASATEYVLSC